MRASRLYWFAFFAAAASCTAGDETSVLTGSGGSGGGVVGGEGGTVPHNLDSILITPLNLIVELDVNATGTQPYFASGLYSDGTSEDLTDRVTWSVTNAAVGSFDGAFLQLPAFPSAQAEVSLVKASLDGLEGTAQITVVAYRKTGPQQDFFFVLPYQDPEGNSEKPLDFSTAVPALDAFFVMDVTGSMGGAIFNLQQGLTTTIIPGVTGAVADSQFGVGAIADFPIQPYGGEANGCGNGLPPGIYDQPFLLLQEITSDVNAAITGVNKLSVSFGGSPIGCGYDGPESQIEGLYQIATGEGLSEATGSPPHTDVPPNTSGVGGVGFREGAMPVAVMITDIISHAPGEAGNCFGQPVGYDDPPITTAHTRQQAKDALNEICGRVVGISLENFGCSPLVDLEDMATATGSLISPTAWDVPARPPACAVGQCCTGLDGSGRPPNAEGLCPVVFIAESSGNGLGNHISTGIQMLARYGAFTVNTEKEGETESIDGVPLPEGHTTADFIKAITPSAYQLPPPPPSFVNPTFDTVSFQGVTPGTVVTFDVSAYNDFVEISDDALIYKANIRVLAGECTNLDERDVFILVPPRAVAPPM
jgi:hypothetical protein